MTRLMESAGAFVVRNLFLYPWLPLSYLLLATLSIVGLVHHSTWWSLVTVLSIGLGVPAFYMQGAEAGRFVKWNPRAYPVFRAFHEATREWEMYAGIACIAGFAHLGFVENPLWAIGSGVVFLFLASLLSMDVYNNIREERALRESYEQAVGTML